MLVELTARFDEARNIRWARRLEDLGCHVIYGMAGYKTHAKALLVVRRQSQRIQRYVHLATGNYNDRTARLYSDLGLMTTDRDLAGDVATFFNMLTGFSEAVGCLEAGHRADRPAAPASSNSSSARCRSPRRDRPGLIMAKVNSLQDAANLPGARTARARPGVKVLLNVRGICVPAAGRGRRLREHRGPLDHRPLPRARPRLLLPQRRPRGGLPFQRRLDAPEPHRAAGIAVSDRRRRTCGGG